MDNKDDTPKPRINYIDPAGRPTLRQGLKLFPCPKCGQENKLSAWEYGHSKECRDCDPPNHA